MQIRHLEIKGFKSFKNRTLIPFRRGVNCIVGPNGCGKSNVLDALLWVMGESAPSHLRGSSMEELIFTGTTGRDVASGFGEVSLLLEKTKTPFPSPYSALEEVMLTRRLDREGRSSYLINSQPARLGDIQDFFMDTGAGIHGFSLIEQGAVEQFISSKSSDKRKLIESAAGISRFRTRKKQATKKLLLTRNHTEKLTELLNQQEKQLTRLKKQAEKARQYEDLKKQIRKTDLFLSQKTLTSLKRDISTLTHHLQSSQKHKLSLKKQITGLKSDLEGLAREEREVQTLLQREQAGEQKLKEVFLQTKTTTAKLKAHLSASTEEQTRLHKDLHLTKKNQTLHLTRIKDLKQNLKSKQHELVECERHHHKSQKRYQELVQKLTVVEEKKQTLQARMLKADGLTTNRQALEQVFSESLKELEVQHQELKADLELKQKEIQRLSARQKELHTRVEGTRQTRFSWMDSQKAVSQDIEAFTKDIQHLKTKIQHKHSALQALSLEKQNLQKLKQASSVQKEHPALLQSRGFAPLSRVVRIPPHLKEYQPALLGFLGVRLRSVLCDKTGQVLSFLSTLSPQKKQGGLHFILREFDSHGSTSFSVAEQAHLSRQKGVLLFPEAELLKQGGPDKDLIHRLFGGCVLVKDLEAAFRLKPLYPKWHFITCQAEVMTQTGELICGNYPVYGSMTLSDYDRLLGHLPSQMEKHKHEIHLLETKLKKLQALGQKAQARLMELREKYRSSRFSLLDMQKDLNVSAENKKNLSRVVEAVEAKIQQVRQKKEQVFQKQKALQEEGLKSSSPVEGDLNQLERECEKWQAEKKQIFAQKEALGLRRLSLQKDTEVLQEKVHLFEDTLKTSQTRQDSLKSFTTRAGKKIQDDQKNVLKQELLVRDCAARLKQCQTKTGGLKSHCQALAKKQGESRRSLDQSYQEFSQTQTRISELQLQQEALLSKKQNLQGRVQELYQVDLEQMLQAPSSPQGTSSPQDPSSSQASSSPQGTSSSQDPSSSQASSFPRKRESTPGSVPPPVDEAYLQQLKARLSGQGAVNLLALKEYEELNKEHLFYQKQHEDLTASQKKLQEVIRRIDGFCSKKFMEAFHQVSDYFAKVFSALFEGGEAKLILTDPKNPDDEPGLEIMVQPPGKKIQNMNLLSGGEKAMTALALIFSIFLTKPSPFCILDEIDASLDDANINRFNTLLREMAAVSQIVIITHNKYTMQMADRVFGVTMEEKGVSKVLSMDIKTLNAPGP